ncbi:MAG TPA: HupE/UreJ family protein [Bauldia sp.]|nr:HupE/UreJ family protein [Bauldia sp.]
MTSREISIHAVPKRVLPIVLGFLLIGLAIVAPAAPAAAHEVRPAYLAIEEDSTGEFDVLFKTPMRGDMRLDLSVAFSGKVEALTPVVSRATSDAMVQSWRIVALEPLAGQTVLIDGLQTTMTDALLRVRFADGDTFVERLTPASPQATIPTGQSGLDVAVTYAVQGIEHILFGFDHLLFVAALLLIIGDWRVLIKTITAFTIAHSITLTLATFGLVALPAGPVEALIALSILLVAAEAVRLRRGETSLTITFPWVVAFAFGLLHGFGFAGALQQLGLPQGDIPLALFSFNVGVEAGQLFFVGAVLLVVAGLRQIAAIPREALAVPAYGIGIIAAFWVAERLHAMFG